MINVRRWSGNCEGDVYKRQKKGSKIIDINANSISQIIVNTGVT